MVNIRAITWGSQSLVHQPQQRSTALCWSGAVKLDIFGVVVSVLREYYHTVHQTRQIAGQIKICKKSQASSWGVQHNHWNSSHNRDQQWCTDFGVLSKTLHFSCRFSWERITTIHWTQQTAQQTVFVEWAIIWTGSANWQQSGLSCADSAREDTRSTLQDYQHFSVEALCFGSKDFSLFLY